MYNLPIQLITGNLVVVFFRFFYKYYFLLQLGNLVCFFINTSYCCNLLRENKIYSFMIIGDYFSLRKIAKQYKI